MRKECFMPDVMQKTALKSFFSLTSYSSLDFGPRLSEVQKLWNSIDEETGTNNHATDE